MKIVEVPGVGPVEFPDEMDDTAIANVIKSNILPQAGPESIRGQVGLSPSAGMNSATDRFLSSLWSNINPIPFIQQLHEETRSNPYADIGTVLTKAAIAGILNQGEKIKPAIERGEPMTAMGHTLAAAAPLVGPTLAHPAEQAYSGDVAGALGSLTGLAMPLPIGKLGNAKLKIKPKVHLNPAEASAIAFGERAAIPIDVATASGNPMLHGAKQLMGYQPLSAGIVRDARMAQEAALARTGRQMASDLSPMTTGLAEEAGQSVLNAADAIDQARAAANVTARRQSIESALGQATSATEFGTNRLSALNRRKQMLHNQADTAANQVRALAEQHKEIVTTGMKPSGALDVEGNPIILDSQGNPVMTPIQEEIALPVDTTAAKKSVAHIFDQLKTQLDLSHPQPGYELLREFRDQPDKVSL